jgi:two-component system chemotaxis sensor kinase CheA
LEGDQAHKGIEFIQGTPVYRLRGNLLPLVYLHKELKAESTAADLNVVNIVVLQADDRQFGMVVDAIHDTEEIVVKPLQKQLKGIEVFSGATIMGDGKVALILDVLGLAQRAHVISAARDRSLTESDGRSTQAAQVRHAYLMFLTLDGSRMAISLSQVARLEEFPKAVIERAGNQYVVQYRGEILPLIDVSRALRNLQADRSRIPNRMRKPRKTATQRIDEMDVVPVVVYSNDGQLVGLIVGEILDIAEEEIVSRSLESRAGVSFNAVLQERVTEFLDIPAILRTSDSLSRVPNQVLVPGA